MFFCKEAAKRDTNSTHSLICNISAATAPLFWCSLTSRGVKSECTVKSRKNYVRSKYLQGNGFLEITLTKPKDTNYAEEHRFKSWHFFEKS